MPSTTIGVTLPSFLYSSSSFLLFAVRPLCLPRFEIMFFLEFLSLTRCGFGLLLLYIGYYVHWELTIGTSRRRMIKTYGCKPVRYIGDSNSWLNLFVGWGLVKEAGKAVKNHTLLELILNRFSQNGATFGIRFLHYHNISTTEPENVKTMLSTNFQDWSLSSTRKKTFGPLIGKGIFTTDGPAWQHSRELLRPNFVRSQVGNLEMLDKHVDCLLQAIPHDGSTVDLQLLFLRFTLDFATEFLFGESTNCLAPGTSTDSMAGFFDALDRFLAYVRTVKLSPVGKLMPTIFPNVQNRKALKIIHSAVDHWVQIGLERQKSHNLEKTNDERYIFLYELVKSTQDPVKIRSELMNILLAGRDSTAAMLGNTFFVLAKKPEIWAKLQMEVEKLSGERPTLEQIKNMKYLGAVLNEGGKDPNIGQLFSLICYSSASISPGPSKRTNGNCRYCLTLRWRTRRAITITDPCETKCCMVSVQHASTQGLLWGRRGRIQAGEMGIITAGMGVFAFQRVSPWLSLLWPLDTD